MNKCQARSLLLFNGCILNLATRVNPVELAWLRSDFGAIGILKVEIPLDRVAVRPSVLLGVFAIFFGGNERP